MFYSNVVLNEAAGRFVIALSCKDITETGQADPFHGIDIFFLESFVFLGNCVLMFVNHTENWKNFLNIFSCTTILCNP